MKKAMAILIIRVVLMNLVLGHRYLVYRPYLSAGMGNRLSGFHGSLGLAILTNRYAL